MFYQGRSKKPEEDFERWAARHQGFMASVLDEDLLQVGGTRHEIHRWQWRVWQPITALVSLVFAIYFWYDQGDWVRCRRYCFWDIGKERGQICLFYIVFSTDKLLITLQPDIQFLWGLHQNVVFLSCQKMLSKTQNWKCLTCDSFLLIMSHLILM